MNPEQVKAVNSIKEVVQIIDNGGTDAESPEEVAASYAYLSAIKLDTPTKDNLEIALHDLMEEGAMFDFELALENAESILIKTLNQAQATDS